MRVHCTALLFTTLLVISHCDRNLNNTGFEARNGHLIGNGSFIVFSAMDDRYKHNKEFQAYGKRKKKYAEIHAYEYIEDNDKLLGTSQWGGIHPTMLSVHAAKSLLDGSWLGNGDQVGYDWIMFFDADAFPAEMSTPASFFVELGNDFYRRNNKDVEEYPFFIAQDGGHIVNSGWWMLRNCSDSRRFVQQWIKTAKYALDHGLFEGWLHDQGSLQDTILSAVSEANGLNYTKQNSCYHSGDGSIHGRNICFQNRLRSLGFQEGLTRGVRGAGIVLLPHMVGIPYDAHTHSIYKVGQFVWHHKHKNEGNGFNDYHYFNFNWTTFQQDFIHGTMAKQAGIEYKQIFLITVEDGVAVKHAIPDLDTMRNLSHELSGKGYERVYNPGPKGGMMELSAEYIARLRSGGAVAKRDWPFNYR